MVNVASGRRVTFHTVGDEWWIKCTRCTWWSTVLAKPIDTTLWSHLVIQHECNADFYSDEEKRRDQVRWDSR